MVTKIYIVRHCEALGNLSGTFQGSTDCGISQRGELQLKLLKSRFASIPLDIAYSSPLKRARLTAEAAVGGRDIEIITENRFTEIDGGKMEGAPWDKLGELFPVEAQQWYCNFAQFKAPEGESVSDVYNRAGETFIDIANKNKGRTVGIFAHGCAIRTILCRLKGYPVSGIDNVGWTDNTGVTLVEMDENGDFSVIFENDISHLKDTPEALPYRPFDKDNK
ncbi:MAG: histidine phosphatase family protein [Ruminiclostridium sp.]